MAEENMNTFSFSGIKLLALAAILFSMPGFAAQAPGANSLVPYLYNIGTPTFRDLWVDAVHGNDSNNGLSAGAALRTLTAAWDKIPMNSTLTTAYRINVQPGTYTAAMMPTYWGSRHGTFDHPILIRGNGSSRAQVILQGTVNIYDTHYIYFENLSDVFAGDVFHCELCNHVLLRNLAFNGGGVAQETVKVNQTQYFYIENSDLANAWDNVIDFVAVQYGHVVNNTIHGAGDWCEYAKGGSAYLRVEANEIYNCGTGGFSAGQGTGFQYMVSPWIQYEAYDIKVANNIIHDTDGAGLGVNGGYNILLAYNTLYRVGQRSHVIEVVFGLRSCDGHPGDPGREKCRQYLDQGGWGTTVVDDGTNAINIPDKNVFIYNNIIYNPAGYQSGYQHFAIYDARTNPASSHIPTATTDGNLQIRGNVIWNGNTSMPLGIEDNTDACIRTDPTCNAAQLRADNAINRIQPQLLSPATGYFYPTGTWASGVTLYAIPNYVWNIASVPAGNTSNAIPLDYEGNTRSTGNKPGALITARSLHSVTFTSDGSLDGWILESSAASNAGGSLDVDSSTFRLGDDALRKQYRSVLSFATGASLPDTAVITKVTLRIKQQGITGGLANMVTAYQGFIADIKNGSFGTTALQASDFQAAGTSYGPLVVALSSGWYNIDLTTAKADVNKLSTNSGLTQIRLRFKLHDNNNSTANYLSLFSGNADAASRPQLVVEYYTS
jgi:hypothetical protein